LISSNLTARDWESQFHQGALQGPPWRKFGGDDDRLLRGQLPCPELPEVKGVQFLVREKRSRPSQAISLSAPISPKPDLIRVEEKKETKNRDK